jgi:hypothetical protein
LAADADALDHWYGYGANTFDEFCKAEGIERPPQQNRVAERANWTMEEGVVSMLFEAGLPL